MKIIFSAGELVKFGEYSLECRGRLEGIIEVLMFIGGLTASLNLLAATTLDDLIPSSATGNIPIYAVRSMHCPLVSLC